MNYDERQYNNVLCVLALKKQLISVKVLKLYIDTKKHPKLNQDAARVGKIAFR